MIPNLKSEGASRANNTVPIICNTTKTEIIVETPVAASSALRKLVEVTTQGLYDEQ